MSRLRERSRETAVRAVAVSLLATAGATACGASVSGERDNSATTNPPVAESSMPSATASGATTLPRRGSLPSGITVNPTLVLNATNFCTWQLGTKPIPLASLHPAVVRLDDRCNFPQKENPALDQPTGVYSVPAQKPSEQSGNVRDETPLKLDCETAGEPISDAAGNTSDIWVKVTDETKPHLVGYVPDVDLGGGFTTGQLAAIGVKACIAG